MLKKVFDAGRKELKRANKLTNEVLDLEIEMSSLSDEQLKNKTLDFRTRYSGGETLDDLLVESFAVAREASRRVTGMFPYPVQISGGIVIHRGNIAEMKTGEGKTLTAVMPAYLNSFMNKGVHIVTVNEYLARREAEGEIGDIYRFLGLTVGLNIRDITREEKQQAYASDVMYTTNSELGFDYLRDHMVLFEHDMVAQRGYPFSIIDEVDSILVDEARTPLIISGGAKNNQNLYQVADRFVKSLKEGDFEIDVETKTIELLEQGIEKAEKIFVIDNLYDLNNVSLVHHINNALRANLIMVKDVEYMVQENAIIIIDQFTGRTLHGRQFSEGLHQALEAKENVEIKKETITVATITYQNFFRMYDKLSGMTGTAKTEEGEFRDIYNMLVVEVPTNAPIIRQDDADEFFVTLEDKLKALIEEVRQRHELGQPILIGTISVESSEEISRLLRQSRLNHEVLNAKNHAREAEIIANAGNVGSITLATNMAGRGTDIKLGAGVVELGGLAVLGSEKHESRRIDNQLRGRSGRQGDPGHSKFFLSGDDELLIRFGGETFKNQLARIQNLMGGERIESKMFSRTIVNAQKKIEGQNYNARKNVVKYDDVLRQQREVVYGERRAVLSKDSIVAKVDTMIDATIRNDLGKYIVHIRGNLYDINDDGIMSHFDKNIFNQNVLDKQQLESLDESEVVDYLLGLATAEVEAKKKIVPAEVFDEFCKVVMLRVIDTYWMKHIDAMSELRQGVMLQSYGQQNPLIVYQQEGLKMFTEMIDNMARDVTRYVMRAKIEYNTERENVVKGTSTNQGAEEARKKPKVRKNRNQRNMPWR